MCDDGFGRNEGALGRSCMSAVRRAYHELRNKGQPDRFAFEAAVTVYRWHHPEVPAPTADQIVAAWVWNGVSH